MAQVPSLDDKYTANSGSIFISGTHALLRLCLSQRARDAAAGLNTAGFISGYRGSPLGTFDTTLSSAKQHLAASSIVFRPGVNEDIAATSCWGTQQVGLLPGPKHDGVFAAWYGKGPGVDRSGDAFKHGNLAGTSRHGGVLVLAGDDHGAKSSTTAHQSEQALIAAMIPVLFPASVQDCLELGTFVFALSRFAGVWVSFKCVTEVIETSATVRLEDRPREIILPDVETPERGLNIRKGFAPLEDEAHLIRYRLPAVSAFVAANGLDRVVLDGERRTIGIITAGKAYTDTLQALADLGIDAAVAERLGIRLYKLAMTWPVEPAGLVRFASGHSEVLIVEEKRPVIEDQIASILFNAPAAQRPRLTGKRDQTGAPLLPSDGELSPRAIRDAIVKRLAVLGLLEAPIKARHAELVREAESLLGAVTPAIQRSPAFCSGCPHSTSTRLPEGSLALAGIGCHSMALFMPDRPTMPPTQMGGEGANWIGMAAFSGTPHVFQNLGDGTYFHSGLIAIRAAVAAAVNITYKILFNDAVAMTGGQRVDGELTVPSITAQLRAEGVTEIVVVTDQPEKYAQVVGLAPGTKVRHRDELISIEQHLREVRGVSALIYDQTCAAEKRRRRKRQQWPDPAKRYFINDLVCEGCGDCSVQSGCVSVLPLETELGRKRQIDQSSCNKDYSCVKGFCPSFVTVLGGRPRRQGGLIDDKALAAAVANLQSPPLAPLGEPVSILIAGIGGTGVVTAGAILGMAAKLESRGATVLDITGLSQKNGAVLSHLKLMPSAMDPRSARIGLAQADVLLGCDLIVAGSTEALSTLRSGKSRAVVNDHVIPTAQFQHSPDMDFQSAAFSAAIKRRLGADDCVNFLDATGIAERVFGSNMGANMLLVGYAFQRGYIPILESSILAAIKLNGVSVAMNQQAFQLGRLAAEGGESFEKLAQVRNDDGPRQSSASLDDIVQRRSRFLTDYQDAAYAQRYKDFVAQVREAEDSKVPGHHRLAEAVAHNLFKLMAYKDEYEVARLHTTADFRRKLEEQFEGEFRIEFNFAPPLLARRDPATGQPKKRAYGRGAQTLLKILRHGRRLRGTALDLFGYTQERMQERRAIERYRAVVGNLLANLTAENHGVAVEIASIPEKIRGFGHVKARNIAIAEAAEKELIARFEGGMTGSSTSRSGSADRR